jgi:hypothetical protein
MIKLVFEKQSRRVSMHVKQLLHTLLSPGIHLKVPQPLGANIKKELRIGNSSPALRAPSPHFRARGKMKEVIQKDSYE